MGFMDKAKKLAEQAQEKLDEVQNSVNSSQGGQPAGSGPVVEYDKHGRPIPSAGPVPDAGAPPVATPGVPPTAPASTGPTPDPGSPAPSSPPQATPGVPAATEPTPDPAAPDDRNRPSTEAPKLSSGDPLAG